jgi:alpha-tubulin suppressor-like RCC1 family protein
MWASKKTRVRWSLCAAGVVLASSVVAAAPAVAADNGQLYAWGSNLGYGLGDGTSTTRLTPVPIAGMTTVTMVAGASEGGIALKSNGTVWAWGDNSEGQLGNGPSPAFAKKPVKVAGLSGVVSIAAYAQTRYAVLSSGKVVAWGGNVYEELGNGTVNPSATPIAVPGLINVRSVVAGEGFAYALDGSGKVWGWGMFVYGMPWPVWPPGPPPGSPVPVHLAFPAGIVSIGAGSLDGYAVDSKGRGWSMGYGEYGALGNGGFTDSGSTPVEIVKAAGLKAIASDGVAAYGLLTSGKVLAWGDNTMGDLGTGGAPANTAVPITIPGLTSIKALAGGTNEGMAVHAGRVLTWGQNATGQLGNGTTTPSLSPTHVVGLTGVFAISAGDGSDFAVAN